MDADKLAQFYGIFIEEADSGQVPNFHILGHPLFPSDLWQQFGHNMNYLVTLAENKLPPGEPNLESWWDMLSEKGRKSAKEIEDILWRGFVRSHFDPYKPNITVRYFKISPASLTGGWFEPAEVKEMFHFIGIYLALLFDGKGMSGEDVLRKLYDLFSPYLELLKWFQNEMASDLTIFEAFLDWVSFRAATYADALLSVYFSRMPTWKREELHDTLSETGLYYPLVQNCDPAYPKAIVRIHALSHRFSDGAVHHEITKEVDGQLKLAIEDGFKQIQQRERQGSYYSELPWFIDQAIGSDPYKAVLLDLISEAQQTGQPVTKLAKALGMNATKTSKDASKLHAQLERMKNEPDPLLTFLRKFAVP